MTKKWHSACGHGHFFGGVTFGHQKMAQFLLKKVFFEVFGKIM